MTAGRVDLNCDLGESNEVDADGLDDRIMPCISSANVSCGLHAGNPTVIRRTVQSAVRHGVSLGAHPGFADRAGFGRRPMTLSPAAIQDLVVYQLGALAAIASAHGARLRHVKPHGALYNMAAVDRVLADAVARAVQHFDPALVLYGLSGSCLLAAGRYAGLTVASEVFADRAYRADGTLVPRGESGAVVTDPVAVVERGVAMVTEGRAPTIDGGWVDLEGDTICVHGDTRGAVTLAGRLRAGLEAAGVSIAPVGGSPTGDRGS